MSVSGFIQAGGQSSRMGTNKALVKLGEMTLIEYPLKALQPLVSQLAIIANNSAIYQYLSLPCYPDIWPGVGPLGGIGTALTYAENEYVVVLACDMPCVTTPFLELLISASKGYQVCIPTDAQGQLQPLAAIYHCTALPQIKKMLAQHQFAPRFLLKELNGKVWTFDQFAHLPNAEKIFENINTQQDLIRLNNCI